MMKKLLLTVLLIFLGMSPAMAQNDIKLGVHGGAPLGDADDISSFALSADVAYLFDPIGILEVGPLVGYSHFFGDEDFDDLQFIPVAASGRVSLPQLFFVGVDLGYAFGLDDTVDGGFYYRPQIGYNFLNFAFVLSYSGITDENVTISSLNFGVELKF